MNKKIIEKKAKSINYYGRIANYDRILVDTTDSTPIWARFYDIKTQKPLFYEYSRRKAKNYNSLSRERRTGYYYYGNWPIDLLKYDYPKWKNKFL